jgi:peroxiredoxin
VHALLIVALVLPWVFVGVMTLVLYVLIKQHGEFLHREQQLAASAMGGQAMPQMDYGLPVGSDAPDLALKDLEGHERRIAEFFGQPFVLTFFNTGCGYCTQMAPRLGELPEGAPRLVLVSSGDVDQLKTMADTNNWGFDVLHEGPEAATFKAYEPVGTPSAYLIDSEGKIGEALAVGADAIMELLESSSAAAPVVPSCSNGSNGAHADVAKSLREKEDAAVERAQRAGLRASSTSESRIKRDGLEAGTMAPNFVVRDLKGDVHSLTDYRGRRVLLVFSDVSCGPCEALAPDLVRLAGDRDDVQVVMISRGDPDLNREKAERHEYPFPVLLQKSWEISKQYGMFATPIGYLIDEDGVIVKDVAVGNDAILGLAAA